MVRKPQSKKGKEASEAEAVDQAAQAEADKRQSWRQEPRRLTPASFRSRRKRRRAEKKLARTKVAGSFRILGRAIMILRNHWEVFGGLFLIYALINTILTAGSLLNTDLVSLRDQLLVDVGVSRLGVGLAIFETLFATSTGSASGPAGAYQTLLIILTSLAIVWALRQLSAGNKIRIRDALYNSCYPLIQVLLVMLVMSIQLLPATVGSYVVYGLIGEQIVTVGWQQAIVYCVALLLFVWTVYLLISSIIALYIATLPGMTPLKALRSAKEIVRYRRAMVLRKLLFLPLSLLVVVAAVVIPVGAFLPVGANVLFFVLGMACLPLVHAYIYMLYRELIKSA